jgi:predicted neutral ceramidase superfamily lipid hydrolase
VAKVIFRAGIGILIPIPVVYRLSPSRRINVFGSNLPAAEPVEVWEASVLVLSTLSFLVGAALAQRFKIMVLIPAVATVLTLAVGIGLTNAYTSWSIVVTAATAATSMQIGYLIGMSIHGLLAAASSRSAPSTSARHSAR